MKYCYDVPTKNGNEQVCYAEDELKKLYRKTYNHGMSYEDFVQEWITVNWGYRVEENQGMLVVTDIKVVHTDKDVYELDRMIAMPYAVIDGKSCGPNSSEEASITREMVQGRRAFSLITVALIILGIVIYNMVS